MSTEAVGAGVPAPMDPDSEAWVTGLTGTHGDRETTVANLHRMMLRVATAEASRRYGVHGLAGPELDDLAHQAASDAVVSVLGKVADFRGESRFTTWAYKFAVYEVSNKLGRHVWRHEGVRLDTDAWERLPAALGSDPERVAESTELVAVVRAAVESELSPRQRQVFVAIVVEATPLDALALELGTTRNAIYKTLFDARRKLRNHLIGTGYLELPPRRTR